MARALLRVFLISALCGASASGNEEQLRQAIAELEGLIQNQQVRIQALKAEEPDTRRLQADARPSVVYKFLNSTLVKGQLYRPYTTEENQNGALDHIWLLLCGAMVLFMQAGFTMFEASVCRFVSVQNILLKNMTGLCLCTLAWWVFGWSFAFSGNWDGNDFSAYKASGPYDKLGYKTNGFGGGTQFLGHHFLKSYPDGQQEPTYAIVNWFFQWAYCAVATTIALSGLAERALFPAYAVFSFIFAAFIYPFPAAWTWGNGYLAWENKAGYFDWAGGGVVHLAGGLAALIATILAGPREGRFTDLSAKQRMSSLPEAYMPHSLPLIVFGVFIIWFGWYGMACGATDKMNTIEHGFLAGQIAMNITIAAATGGIFTFCFRWLITRKYDIVAFCRGIVVGLVSVSAACSSIECGSACGIAVCGALWYTLASMAIRAARVDDPTDAFAIHGVCGMWALFSAPWFDWGKGIRFYHGMRGFRCIQDAASMRCIGENDSAVKKGQAANILEIIFIILWVGAVSLFFLVPMKFAGLLRPNDKLGKESFDVLEDNKEVEPMTLI